jgi:phosphatidylglycerophosphatase A
MTEKTDPASPAAQGPSEAVSSSTFAAKPQKKPRLALFIATAGGLGYFPKAPGTFGSLVGSVVAIFPWWLLVAAGLVAQNERLLVVAKGNTYDPLIGSQILIAFAVGALGVWSADRTAKYWSQKDPQRVVIDEVSGQHLALLLGCAVPVWWKPQSPCPEVGFGFISVQTALNWKYLLLGFILFRVFDIWKPFPARQAESLPGGWGIMTDDWVAGIYAALGLWLARAAGL